jgi:hypothetical protein
VKTGHKLVERISSSRAMNVPIRNGRVGEAQTTMLFLPVGAASVQDRKQGVEVNRNKMVWVKSPSVHSHMGGRGKDKYHF